jgi:Cu/Ag efflux pump CusA
VVVKSVVEEITGEIRNHFKLQLVIAMTYGGQFEL